MQTGAKTKRIKGGAKMIKIFTDKMISPDDYMSLFYDLLNNSNRYYFDTAQLYEVFRDNDGLKLYDYWN